MVLLAELKLELFMQKDKNYIFICSCARSGSTVLWDIVSSHSKVVLGLERYIHRAIKSEFTLTPAHFEKERFFEIQEGDTHFKSLYDDPTHNYQAFEKNFDDASHVGDKIPKLYLAYDDLFEKFPGAKVLFIYRNIFDVAQSYKARLINTTDGWNRDFVQAVDEWNEALTLTLLKIKQGFNILPINYERLFYGQMDPKFIFEYLDLPHCDQSYNRFLEKRELAKGLSNRHAGILSPMEKTVISNNANFFRYKKIENILGSLRLTELEDEVPIPILES